MGINKDIVSGRGIKIENNIEENVRKIVEFYGGNHTLEDEEELFDEMSMKNLSWEWYDDGRGDFNVAIFGTEVTDISNLIGIEVTDINEICTM
jgi:hypothetical protein